MTGSKKPSPWSKARDAAAAFATLMQSADADERWIAAAHGVAEAAALLGTMRAARGEMALAWRPAAACGDGPEMRLIGAAAEDMIDVADTFGAQKAVVDRLKMLAEWRNARAGACLSAWKDAAAQIKPARAAVARKRDPAKDRRDGEAWAEKIRTARETGGPIVEDMRRRSPKLSAGVWKATAKALAAVSAKSAKEAEDAIDRWIDDRARNAAAMRRVDKAMAEGY